MPNLESRLAALGLSLPDPGSAVANYLPYLQTGSLLHISGQLSRSASGQLITGRLGADLDVPQGAEAARRCALSLLAQVSQACGGDLTRLLRAVRLTGFVASTADFTDQPKVINGASDLLVALLGEAGRHTRSAVSVPALPLGAAVEIDAIFELRP